MTLTKQQLRHLRNVDFKDMSGIGKKENGTLKKNYVQLPWGIVVHVNQINEALKA